MFSLHRRIWYFTVAVAATAAAVLLMRGRVDAPSSEMERDPEAVVAEMLGALNDDPRVQREETRALVVRVGGLAEEGRIDSAEAALALGLLRMNRGDAAGAEEAMRRAAGLRPEWGWPHTMLGIVLFGEKRHAEAEACFLRAIAAAPTWSRPHNDLAILLRTTGRLDEAEPHALRAIALDPDNVAGQNNYGNLLVELGRLEDAEAAYWKAVALDPDHPAPHYNLACLASLQGRPEAAFGPLRRAVELDDAFRREALKDPDFDALRDLPEFQAIVHAGPD